MNNRFEQFIHDNRDQFNADMPDPQLWKKIEKELHPRTARKLYRMNVLRWSAAAAVLIIAGLSVFYFLNSRTGKNNLSVTQTSVNDKPETNSEMLNDINPAYAKEVYHFTQLIEIKQNELKQIEKDQPDLYNKFIGDVNRLDSSYNVLKKELPENANREQLLEAMIQNLRLQTDLLNQQLLIIQKIKQSKNSSNESNSKSI